MLPPPLRPCDASYSEVCVLNSCTVDGFGNGTLSRIDVVRVDTFQLVVVINGTLTVDVDRHGATTERVGLKHLRVCAGGKCQQRQEVSGRERQGVDGRGLQSLSGGSRT